MVLFIYTPNFSWLALIPYILISSSILLLLINLDKEAEKLEEEMKLQKRKANIKI
jgi:hypothetical protein